MRGQQEPEPSFISLINVEQLIAQDHPIRRIKQTVDEVLRRMGATFDAMYARQGRPSIPPEQVLKAKVLQALLSVRSDRQLCARLQTDLMFRWFIDLGLDEKVFDASSFSQKICAGCRERPRQAAGRIENHREEPRPTHRELEPKWEIRDNNSSFYKSTGLVQPRSYFCMKSNQDWEKWGESDPLFAVSTWEGKEKGGKQPWTVDEFYANGKSDCDDFMSAWKPFGYDRRHLVEIGCGAGRLTNSLATSFDRVTGLDVSEGQIKFAQGNVRKGNVTWHKVNGVDMPLENGGASAVFSAHDFQHFESVEDAAKVFTEIHRVLQPSGSLMIHLPVFAIPDYPVGGLVRKIVSLSKAVGNLKADINRRRGKMIMRTLVYDQKWLVTFLEELGFDRIEFRTFRVKSNRAWHEFILAQKST